MPHVHSRRFALSILLTSSLLFFSTSAPAQDDLRHPSGQDYIEPEEAVARMQVIDGYQAHLFAAEPDVVNPVAMAWDERGRLWVLELYEYPDRTPEGELPRDRLRILEDTDGDHRADVVKTFLEGSDLGIRWDTATGMELGYGGVFLGCAPYLLHVRDSDGDDHADEFEILLEGFGSQDTHETLNTFTWGPDGWLYGLHGVFTRSEINGIPFTAAVWRYHPRTREFEIFAEGTSNPWGMTFDARGNCFLVCCVIPHLYHVIPGGLYRRQAGQNANPYAFGELQEISDHLHHEDGGWAHAGLLVLEGDHVPEHLRGSIIMGSIHGNDIKRDLLERRGSTFVARHAEPFCESNDGNFRPINLRYGPDGSIYLIDWHDQLPCHQFRTGWDYHRGRIYCFTPTGVPREALGPVDERGRPGDLSQRTNAELVGLLRESNPWWRDMARRILIERAHARDQREFQLFAEPLEDQPTVEQEIAELTTGHAADAWNEFDVADSPDVWAVPDIRRWSIRLLAEDREISPGLLPLYIGLARQEQDAGVRLELACAALRWRFDRNEPADARLVNRLVAEPAFELELEPQGHEPEYLLALLGILASRAEDDQDPCIPFMLWLATERHVIPEREAVLGWLRERADEDPLLAHHLLGRACRRLAVTGEAEHLQAALALAADLREPFTRRVALEGIVAGLEGRQVEPPANWSVVSADFFEDPDESVREAARQLAGTFRDPEAVARAVATAADPAAATDRRVSAIRLLALVVDPQTLRALEQLVRDEALAESAVRREAIRALRGFEEAGVPDILLSTWTTLTPAERTEAAGVLASRGDWAHRLLDAVAEADAALLDEPAVPPPGGGGGGGVSRDDLTSTIVVRIRAIPDDALRARLEEVYGTVREQTPAEIEALIARMTEAVNSGTASAARGGAVFEQRCAVCHRLHGEGNDVGPDLTGAARDDISYLLINILDPNRVVGLPYRSHTVATLDGQVHTGMLVAEDETSITLRRENNEQSVIPKDEIDERVVQDISVMPEGLQRDISEQEFRDLLAYLMPNPYLREVELSGPYFGDDPFERPFAPEQGGDSAWLPYSAPVTGRIDLQELPVDEAIAGPWAGYVRAALEADTARTVRLRFGSDSPVRIWLNGARVFSQASPAGDGPDALEIELALEGGANELLFKLARRDGTGGLLWARVVGLDEH